MSKALNNCVLFLVIMIYLCSCTNTDIKYSKRCGNYAVLNEQTLIIDTIYIFDPAEFKEKRYVRKKYTEKKYQTGCKDTLSDGFLIYEIGTLDNNPEKYLLSEMKLEYYPYK